MVTVKELGSAVGTAVGDGVGVSDGGVGVTDGCVGDVVGDDGRVDVGIGVVGVGVGVTAVTTSVIPTDAFPPLETILIVPLYLPAAIPVVLTVTWTGCGAAPT